MEVNGVSFLLRREDETPVYIFRDETEEYIGLTELQAIKLKCWLYDIFSENNSAAALSNAFQLFGKFIPGLEPAAPADPAAAAPGAAPDDQDV